MKPVTEVSISEFLVTRTPILNFFMDKYVTLSYYSAEKMYACYVTKDIADTLYNRLSLRLPTEEEWEYFVRAGSKDLFTFGSELTPI